MYISFYDVGLFILFTVILTVSGFLIAVLRRTFCVLGHVQEILGVHSEDIGKIISELPEVLENVNELTVSLKRSADLTTSAFGSLQNNVLDTVDDMRDGLETFVVYAKIIGEVCRSVFGKSG
ncbi:MAG: hypothetical protein H7X79_04810 [Sporomusaceae bacterium]|nr:hypothetical protein [Sporomusaceae bacterium]